jgi:hypothetical protein
MAAVIPVCSPKCLKSRGGRRTNQELRSREHLTPDEVERMITAARQRISPLLFLKGCVFALRMPQDEF